ncbi:carboxylate-amine ligase [Arthrobacter sp. H14-L1]|uniref:carboxylate-amine ligase n=1 Tax=Arthrobacter sp. H14-L1 TaxID=2996697 RepID=UPI0022711D27|nr:YbdK family carboxylate-amine ligase [Arthrobacter sp. H14-L1]MCY0903590.1 YbdK family carboxylate-amine ligase [Arthrobacter sp. H14-L1]
MVTFGIEEEYLLVDPATGLPKFISSEVSARLQASVHVDDGDIQHELLACQLETSTPPCHTAQEALESLLAFRGELSKAAHKSLARAASTGAAPKMDEAPPEITDDRRYHRLRGSARAIVADQYVNGLHVHVNVPDKEAGVRALNRIRPWLPTLVALSANSPFWQDRDSGFESWRTISYRRWPVQGIPPVFNGAADYEDRVQHLIDTGVIIDRGVITWVARLSENYPTLEVRACDAQLEARDSVLLAVLIRALVTTALNGPSQPDPAHPGSAPAGSAPAGSAPAGSAYAGQQLTPELLDAALWQAARHGLSEDLIHPATGRLAPAADVTAALLALVQPALVEAGDSEFAADGLARMVERGTGSVRQRRARDQGGLPALLDLFSASLTAG